MDSAQLRIVLAEVLDEHFTIHSQHHAWIQARIDAEESRKNMYSEIRKAAIQWSIAGLLGAFYYWLQDHFKL